MITSTAAPTAMQPSAISPQSYSFLQAYVHRESGIVLDGDKQYLFQARLLPIVQRQNLGSIDALCDRVASGLAPALAAQVPGHRRAPSSSLSCLSFESEFGAFRLILLPSQ